MNPGTDRWAQLPALQRRMLAAAASLISLALVVHAGMTFLHIAPDNALSTKYDEEIDDYMGPEFSQGWRLFAPDLAQSNMTVHARAQVRTAAGAFRTTGWVDLTATDVAEVRHNPLPDRTVEQLRRAWTMLVTSHDNDQRPLGRQGLDAERFLKRLALPRLTAAMGGGEALQIQVRSLSAGVPPPPWEAGGRAAAPTTREFPWWPVSAADTTGGEER